LCSSRQQSAPLRNSDRLGVIRSADGCKETGQEGFDLGRAAPEEAAQFDRRMTVRQELQRVPLPRCDVEHRTRRSMVAHFSHDHPPHTIDNGLTRRREICDDMMGFVPARHSRAAAAKVEEQHVANFE